MYIPLDLLMCDLLGAGITVSHLWLLEIRSASVTDLELSFQTQH